MQALLRLSCQLKTNSANNEIDESVENRVKTPKAVISQLTWLTRCTFPLLYDIPSPSLSLSPLREPAGSGIKRSIMPCLCTALPTVVVVVSRRGDEEEEEGKEFVSIKCRVYAVAGIDGRPVGEFLVAG